MRTARGCWLTPPPGADDRRVCGQGVRLGFDRIPNRREEDRVPPGTEEVAYQPIGLPYAFRGKADRYVDRHRIGIWVCSADLAPPVSLVLI